MERDTLKGSTWRVEIEEYCTGSIVAYDRYRLRVEVTGEHGAVVREIDSESNDRQVRQLLTRAYALHWYLHAAANDDERRRAVQQFDADEQIGVKVRHYVWWQDKLQPVVVIRSRQLILGLYSLFYDPEVGLAVQGWAYSTGAPYRGDYGHQPVHGRASRHGDYFEAGSLIDGRWYSKPDATVVVEGRAYDDLRRAALATGVIQPEATESTI